MYIYIINYLLIFDKYYTCTTRSCRKPEELILQKEFWNCTIPGIVWQSRQSTGSRQSGNPAIQQQQSSNPQALAGGNLAIQLLYERWCARWQLKTSGFFIAISMLFQCFTLPQKICLFISIRYLFLPD